MITTYNVGMNTLAERLLIAMDKNPSLSKTGLWKACGLSSGAVSHWFSGGTKELKGDNLLKAATYLGVNIEWLSSGKGDMEPKQRELKQEKTEYSVKPGTVVAGIKINSMEENLLSHYSKLSGSSQRAIDLLVNHLYSLEHPEDLKANPNNGKKKKAMEKQ